MRLQNNPASLFKIYLFHFDFLPRAYSLSVHKFSHFFLSSSEWCKWVCWNEARIGNQRNSWLQIFQIDFEVDDFFKAKRTYSLWLKKLDLRIVNNWWIVLHYVELNVICKSQQTHALAGIVSALLRHPIPNSVWSNGWAKMRAFCVELIEWKWVVQFTNQHELPLVLTRVCVKFLSTQSGERESAERQSWITCEWLFKWLHHLLTSVEKRLKST